MTQANLSQAIAVNIPPTLTLTVTHEQLVQLAIAIFFEQGIFRYISHLFMEQSNVYQ